MYIGDIIMFVLAIIMVPVAILELLLLLRICHQEGLFKK